MKFHTKYVPNMAILRDYHGRKFKLVQMATCRQKGIEDPDTIFTAKGEAGNVSKLDNNLSRSKATVFELAFCNPWELFVTFTLDKKKYDRHDLETFSKDLSRFIRHYRERQSANVKYLLIPERHKDGAWHMHGFLLGLPQDHLRKFDLGERLPTKIRNRMKEGKKVYTWEAYAKRFGFADIEVIENPEASSKYITKYVTKEALRTITALGAHIYYVSQGMERSKVVRRDILSQAIQSPDYQNDYVTAKWFDTLGEAMECFEGREAE